MPTEARPSVSLWKIIVGVAIGVFAGAGALWFVLAAVFSHNVNAIQ